MRIGVDTGGTFTDLVCIDAAGIRLAKVPSTPDDPARAIVAGLASFGRLPAGATIVHGTTVATNALLQGRLARAAFVTTAGFEDVLEIGRQARPNLYALDVVKIPPVVPAARRIGVRERVTAGGVVLAPLTDREVARVKAAVARVRPEAIAIGLLFGFAAPEHERRLARALAGLGVPVCTSHAVAPAIREFERFSTTAMNAALMPVAGAYLQRLARAIRGAKLFIFQSNGGMAAARTAAAMPVRLALSGPAGGCVAAERILRRAGVRAAITLDMGGTSTDVALIAGKALRRGELSFEGHPLLVPSLDIESVGAGGGSIAHVDATGMLRVGPQSAGADPGPACHGRSDLPTVTDAHVVLGRLPLALAGGAVHLDADRSHRALESLGRKLRLDRFRAAEGVLAVADAAMARAARLAATQRGRDPAALPLFAFGGAGPLHAVRLMRALRSPEAIVPPLPGHLSAYGMALADAERDLARSVLLKEPERRLAALARALDSLERQGRRELARDGLLPHRARVEVERSVEVRYAGQTDTLEVAFSKRLRRDFERAHRAAFGHAFEDRAIEAVDVKVRLWVPRAAPAPRRAPPDPAQARIGVVRARFGGRSVAMPCFAREHLPRGFRVAGPARIEEAGATTIVEPGARARVDDHGNLRLNDR